MERNVFVLGYDTFHAHYLQRLHAPEAVRYRPLLQTDEVVYQVSYGVDAMLDKARKVLDDFSWPVDGIITHWDFPAISLLAVLCEERGLRGPSLESVLKCEHKYWSRLEQQRAVPESTPAFCAVDPFDHKALEKLTIDFPFWIKPVKGYSSALGFHIEGPEDFRRAMNEARHRIRRFGDPLNELLARLELPDEIAEIDGNHMIAEELVGGREVAPEGFVQHDQVHVHGLVDVVLGENGKSMERVEYPSRLPAALTERIEDTTRKVVRQIGLNDGCFNIEYFWDEEKDRLWIVEVNPRLSQSHSNLFEKVDGKSNHSVAVQLALGQEVEFEHGSGPYQQAAKVWWRRYDPTEAVATRAPTHADITALKERQPDTLVELGVREGMQLSELLDQDPYSYVLAELHVGADSPAELDAKIREAQEFLPFEFENVPFYSNKALRRRVSGLLWEAGGLVRSNRPAAWSAGLAAGMALFWLLRPSQTDDTGPVVQASRSGFLF